MRATEQQRACEKASSSNTNCATLPEKRKTMRHQIDAPPPHSTKTSSQSDAPGYKIYLEAKNTLILSHTQRTTSAYPHEQGAMSKQIIGAETFQDILPEDSIRSLTPNDQTSKSSPSTLSDQSRHKFNQKQIKIEREDKSNNNSHLNKKKKLNDKSTFVSDKIVLNLVTNTKSDLGEESSILKESLETSATESPAKVNMATATMNLTQIQTTPNEVLENDRQTINEVGSERTYKLTDIQLERLNSLIRIIRNGSYNEFLELLEKRRFKHLLNVFVDGHTALHYSLIYGRSLAWCKQLVTNGANPNLTNRAGWHPIHLAAFNGSRETMRYLIDSITT